MATTKHTPGPWRIASFEKNPSLCLRVWSGEIEVAQINHWGKPEKDLTCDPKPSGQAEANARLIATAPELLDIMKSIAAEAMCYDHGPKPYSGDSYLPEHFRAGIRAVLAKAEGTT